MFSWPPYVHLCISSLISFLVVYLITPRLIGKLNEKNLTGVDVHKPGKPRIPLMGGLAIIAGYLSGALWLLIVFPEYYGELISVLSSILMISMLGVIDDVLDLRHAVKVLLPILASLPLTLVVGEDRVMLFPILGLINLGVAYPLILVPVGVAASANLVNMLAGFNGLEAGMGLIAASTLSVSALLVGSVKGAILLAPMIGALSAFLIYNRYPAKIFPGNSTTYAIGAAVAGAVIVGDMEVLGVICLAPYVAEFFVKVLHRFKGECFGVLTANGSLRAPENIASLTHALMRIGKLNEQKLVATFYLIEAFCGSIAIVVAYFSLYLTLFPS